MHRVANFAVFAMGVACTFGGAAGTGDDGETGPVAASESGAPPGTTGLPPLPTSTDGPAPGDSSEGGDSTSAAPGTTTDMGEDSSSSGSSTDTGEEPLPSGPFGEPVLIEQVSDPAAQDDDPTVRFDELEMYINSTRNDQDSIYVSTRASVDALWGTPELVEELSSSADDSTPMLSDDGLVMTLSSRRSSVNFNLFIAYRDDFDDDWSDPVAIDGLNTATGEFNALFFDDTVYFCRVTNKTPFQAIAAEVLDFDKLSFGKQTVLSPPSTDVNVCGLTIRRDRLELFVGEGPNSALVIKRFERTDTNSGWDPGVEEATINEDLIAEDPWVSWDAHRLYFTGRPKEGDGIRGIYVAER